MSSKFIFNGAEVDCYLVKATVSNIYKDKDVSYSSYTSGGGGYVGPSGGHISPVTTKTTRHVNITQRLSFSNVVYEEGFPYPALNSLNLDYQKIQRIDEKFKEGDEVSIVYLMHKKWRKKLKDEFDTSKNDGLVLSLIRNESTFHTWDFYPKSLMKKFHSRFVWLWLIVLPLFVFKSIYIVEFWAILVILFVLNRIIVFSLLNDQFKSYIRDIINNKNKLDVKVGEKIGAISYIMRNKKLLSALDTVKNNPELNEIIQKAKNTDELIEYANKLKDSKEVNDFLNRIKDNKELDGYLESIKSNEGISEYIDKIKSQKKLSRFFKMARSKKGNNNDEK